MPHPYPYHIADVRRLNVEPRGFQAFCACGWVGIRRDTAKAASDDALAHDTAHNTDA